MGTVTTALRGKNATQGQPRKLDYLHTKYVIQLRDLPATIWVLNFFPGCHTKQACALYRNLHIPSYSLYVQGKYFGSIFKKSLSVSFQCFLTLKLTNRKHLKRQLFLGIRFTQDDQKQITQINHELKGEKWGNEVRRRVKTVAQHPATGKSSERDSTRTSIVVVLHILHSAYTTVDIIDASYCMYTENPLSSVTPSVTDILHGAAVIQLCPHFPNQIIQCRHSCVPIRTIYTRETHRDRKTIQTHQS